MSSNSEGSDSVEALGSVTHHSITNIAEYRRPEEVRQHPVLIRIGNADGGMVPRNDRFRVISGALSLGRHDHSTSEDENSFWTIPDRLISSRHATISRGDEGYRLVDLNSTNGSLVDGLLAEPQSKLREGSVVFLGAHSFVFRMVSSSELEAMKKEQEAPFGPVPTLSPGLALACQKLRKLAPEAGEILFTGETGVGKEVYAKAVHRASGRTGPFLAINCAAIPRELFESELFGYVQGAHSQARGAKAGLLEEADRGTLFLDEIGEMPLELQTKFLRFIQDRQLIPLGGTRPRQVDVRVLAATNRTVIPTSETGSGLRADLAARLGAEPVRLPPLRERIEDLGALIGHFLPAPRRRFELSAFQALCLYAWPGNIRELEKVLVSAEILSRDAAAIGFEHLPAALATVPARIRPAPSGKVLPPPPTQVELEALLRKYNGNIHRVARVLDRKPFQVYRWVRKFGLKVDAYRDTPE